MWRASVSLRLVCGTACRIRRGARSLLADAHYPSSPEEEFGLATSCTKRPDLGCRERAVLHHRTDGGGPPEQNGDSTCTLQMEVPEE
ncbi:hypothetical protein NDU88_006543 [Pleurodeles waltl]|uniref:Secreted protein n=1 Tax=Pleurodeles waltl TaxID=8319 RepID=A0AAV7VPE4_PLEWA|nr:hypothetical protein NDU88_006543 [Pleurodeles waltl]